MAVVITSSPSVTSTVTATAGGWWLKDPLTPANNLAVNLVTDTFTTQQHDRAGVFDVLGRGNSVVITDGVSGEVPGTVRLLTTTPAAYAALYALVTLSRVLLLQSPFGEQWYVWVTGRQRDLARSTAASPWRYTTLTVATVDAP